MAATISGISTVGVLLGYAVETTADTKPAAFTLLERVNSIGGISLSPESIDSSALEDQISRYIQGRLDTDGGNWTITINLTDETKTEVATMISAYQALTNGLRMWFEVVIPDITEGFYVVAQPPQYMPLPEIGQNELLTLELNFIVEEYKGWLTKITPTAA